MQIKTTSYHRYRFNVPDEDNVVTEWLEAQINPSVSLRLLIKEDIFDNGGKIEDVISRTAENMPNARRRRYYPSRRTQVSQPSEQKNNTKPEKNIIIHM